MPNRRDLHKAMSDVVHEAGQVLCQCRELIEENDRLKHALRILNDGETTWERLLSEEESDAVAWAMERSKA